MKILIQSLFKETIRIRDIRFQKFFKQCKDDSKVFTCEIDWLIDFNNISTCLLLFYS